MTKKTILLAALLLAIATATTVLRTPTTPSDSAPSDSTPSDSAPLAAAQLTPPTARTSPVGSVSTSQKLKQIFAARDYTQFAALLAENEAKTLLALSNLGFSAGMNPSDDLWTHLSAIEPYVHEHFADLPFPDTLARLEVMDLNSVPFTQFASTLLFSLSQPSDYDHFLSWLAENPDTQTALSSGPALAEWHLRSGPESAWENVQSLPTSGLRSQAAVSVINSVAQDDVWAAIELINSATDASQDLDSAIAGLDDFARRQNIPFTDRVTIASAPQSLQLRSSALQQVFDEWTRNDPASLAQWLDSPQLPPENAEEILHIAEQAANRYREQ